MGFSYIVFRFINQFWECVKEMFHKSTQYRPVMTQEKFRDFYFLNPNLFAFDHFVSFIKVCSHYFHIKFPNWYNVFMMHVKKFKPMSFWVCAVLLLNEFIVIRER